METKKVRLTSLALAMSLGLMGTMAGCEVNPEGGEGGERGTEIESEYEGGEGGEAAEDSQ